MGVTLCHSLTFTHYKQPWRIWKKSWGQMRLRAANFFAWRCVSMLTPFHPFCRFIAIQADLKCCISATECPLMAAPILWMAAPILLGKGRAGVKKAVVESPKSATLNFNIVDAHTAAMQCSGMPLLGDALMSYMHSAKWLSATAARG